MYSHIRQRPLPSGKTCIFLGEIQLCPGVADAANSLCKQQNVDLYLTGSNAVTLSGELATRIAGRYVEISMLPFSFQEFLNGTAWSGSLSEADNAYLPRSSFPFALQLTDPEQVRIYLNSVHDSIAAGISPCATGS